VGIEHQHTAQLARAECDAGIKHPDQPVGAGEQVPGSALKQRDRLQAHHRETHDPVDDGLGARGLAEVQPVCQSMQHARHGAKADASACKQGESQPHPLGREDGGPALLVAPGLFGLVEGLFGQVALLAKTLEFFAQVAMVLGSFCGVLFPLLAALCACGWLAHPAPPGQGLSPRALDAHGIRLTRIAKLTWPYTTKVMGTEAGTGT
jgi:hypothetical protein